MILILKWLTKDWRIFQILSTIEMRQSLVNHCIPVIIFLNNFDKTTTNDSFTINKRATAYKPEYGIIVK